MNVILLLSIKHRFVQYVYVTHTPHRHSHVALGTALHVARIARPLRAGPNSNENDTHSTWARECNHTVSKLTK